MIKPAGAGGRGIYIATVYDGAFDKRTITELSGDVVREIAKNSISPVIGYWEGICGTLKYENAQKGVGDMMSGALIETSARVILSQGINQGIDEMKKRTALKMLKTGKLPMEEIAEYSELSVEEVEQLAKTFNN